MKIAAVRLHAYRLGLRTTIETAHERLAERLGLWLEIESEAGHRGFGDACPIAGFGLEDLARCDEVLARFAAGLPGSEIGRDRAALLAQFDRVAPDARAARGALDTAWLDVASRIEGVSFARWLVGAKADAPRCDALPVACLIVGDDLDTLSANGRAAAARGFATVKLKLGARPLREDLERVATLRAAIGPVVGLRVDANGGWSERSAASALPVLADLGVELIEQPVPADDLDALGRLRALGLVRIAADESATSLARIEQLLDAEAVDVIVLKPGALGGPTAALAAARLSRARGCEVFVTSLLDSAIGVMAAAQLASQLPGPRPADGLATSALFVRDVAPGPRIEAGRLCLPDSPGLGLVPDPAALTGLCRAAPREWTT